MRNGVFTTTNDDADIPIAEQTINREGVFSLANETSIRDVIAIHQQRTAARNLVRYEAETIDHELVLIAQEFHDVTGEARPSSSYHTN